MDVCELAMDDLVLEPDLNLRDRLDPETVERYAEAWGRTPPVVVIVVDGRYLLADGFHRHAAAAKLGKRTIPAEVRVGPYEEALDVASAANLAHGLPLTRAERRRAVEVQLRLHHDHSDRRLAETLGVGRDLIGRIRRDLVAAGQVPAGEGRVGADGKVYPSALGRDPNEQLPGRESATRDDPRDHGSRESDAAPWDDTTDPLPPLPDSSGALAPPWDTGDASAFARTHPVDCSTPTIDEMLAIMTRQVREVLQWSEAEGFAEAFAAADRKSRGPFLDAVARLQERSLRLKAD